MFDAVQIHLFARPGITSDIVCLAVNPVTRIVGAISLWSVEIIMQLRIYALFGASKKVAVVNGILFLGSVAGWVYILVHNVTRTEALIADAVRLPLPGCPTIHVSTEWAQWVPATAYEGILFSFAVYGYHQCCELSRDAEETHLSLPSAGPRQSTIFLCRRMYFGFQQPHGCGHHSYSLV